MQGLSGGDRILRVKLTLIDDLMTNPGRSRQREYLLTTHFIRDMVIAAGHCGYDLLV